MKQIAALLTGLALLLGGGSAAAEEAKMTAYEAYLADGEAPSLAQKYEGIFAVGVATSPEVLRNEKAAGVITAHFNSLTCENQMKPDFTMDRSASKRSKDNTRVKLSFIQAAPVLKFAQEHGMKVRAHTLVWHSQTPRWFFAEDWSDRKDAPLVDRDTMILRMENYIRDEMEYINTNYPGLVYAWDVVNEAIEPGNGHPEGLRTQNNLWYETIGDDWVELAFTFARKYAAQGQKLFYNDYGCTGPLKLGLLKNLLQKLADKGLVDGLGMQSHIAVDSPSLSEYENAVRLYARLGLTIHITELDISTGDNTPLGQMRLAYRYRSLLAMLERLRVKNDVDIESVTVWGLTDNASWLNTAAEKKYPLLFDSNYRCKPAFFGFLQDASIPLVSSDKRLQEAVEKLGLDTIMQQEEDTVSVYKTLKDHNPVMVQRFGADPWAMVYDGRVYLYMTGDEPMIGLDGKPRTNNYSNITTLRVASSDDLVNWQDHGSVNAAGRAGAAKWAGNSWAPCAAWKTIGGQDKFFLYFANSAGGIGVLTADSPTGPFTDPLGHALISRATPTCDTITWLFDPAILMDDDGSAYLYFGGGVPEGKAADPGTARVVKLGDDMISLDGDPVIISPPWLFEDSGINKFGDTYVYSYCSNFSVPSGGSSQGFLSGEIVYMTSDSPMGPFTFAGRVLKNPSAYFGVGGNNHHCMFEFNGKHYITYHAATVDKAMGWNAGYRSTFVDELEMNEAGLPTLSQGTFAGVEQLHAFDPYREVPAAALASLAGAETALIHPEDKLSGTGDMLVRSRLAGGWIGISGVDFGAEGAGGVKLRFTAKEGAKVEILLDDLNNKPAAVIGLPAAGEARSELFGLPETITGVHDLYFRFTQPDTALLQWQFFFSSQLSKGSSLLTASDFPDLDVIRVEDTYYLISTTMHFCPGCAILRSYDLIHWEWCGHLYNALDDTDARALRNGQNCYGKGMWAPSLRWHNGEFYVCFAVVDKGETHIYHTSDIENGPWTLNRLEGLYYDPSLFFDDDGKAYIIHGNSTVRLTELNADLTGRQPGGLDRVLIQIGETRQLGYEGSHFYKINGRYYHFTIHSLPDRWRRVESCFSSDSLTGEFTGGIVFNDDLGYHDQGIAQGGVVDTPDGRWFAFLFQDRGAVGRTPVLLPMTWENGMPVIGHDGKALSEVVNLTARPGHAYAPLAASDSFDAPALGEMWEWNHLPDDSLWETGNGKLTLTAGRTDKALTDARDTLTVRCTYPVTEVTVDVDGSRLKPGDRAGLCALQYDWSAIALRRDAEGFHLSLLKKAGEGEAIAADAPAASRVTLKAVYDFTEMRDTVSYFYLDNGDWQPLGTPQHVVFDLKHFVGVRPGLFCYGSETAGGAAAFTNFNYHIIG